MRLLAVLLFAAATTMCRGDEVFFLPGTTVPESYDLTFYPHFRGADDSTFTGKTKITVTAATTTDTVTLNADELRVTNVTVTDVTDATSPPRHLPITRYFYNFQQFHIVLDRPLTAGQRCEVTIFYEGPIRSDSAGFYITTYKEGDVIKYMAVTNLEPIDARKVFPCYDEPSYKTVFNITVIKDKKLTTLSNMPVFSIEDGPTNGTQTVHFMETPPMSTYLVAIYVGEFLPSTNESKITIYSHADSLNQTNYVWTEASKYLRIMEDYTGINYTLPKIDLVAFPEFIPEAMESWGMNVYKNHVLLHEASTSGSKMRSLITLQHEFAHQWFGNLVTCSKWDYTWLNEAFATYFEYYATAMVNPDWKMEEQFMLFVYHTALESDSYTNPLTKSVNTPIEIRNRFNVVSYQKGASVLRMLQHVVTEELFHRSLKVYLNTNRNKAVTPTDLYAAFDKVLLDSNYTFGNGLSVSKFMSNWTTQGGYPFLNINKNETSNTFIVTQIDVLSTSAFLIGLTYTTESSKNFNDTRPTIWTDEISRKTIVPAPPNSGWYIFNIQSTGFYRVNYDIDNWMALIKQLNEDPNSIHILNRIQLLFDLCQLVEEKKLDCLLPMQLTKYLEKENSTTPWYIVKSHFTYMMYSTRSNEQAYTNYKTYVGSLAGIIYKKLEDLVSKGNSDLYVLDAWKSFATWACYYDNKDCTKNALEYFRKWYSGEKIPADIKDAAFCTGLKYSTEPETFTRLLHLYKTTKSFSEKRSAEYALGCSSNETQLKELMNLLIFDEQKKEKRMYMLSLMITTLSLRPEGLNVLCDFLSANSNGTLNNLLSINNVSEKIYRRLTFSVMTNSEVERLRLLISDHAIPVTTRFSFYQSYKKINRTMSRTGQKINQWIIDNLGSPKELTTTDTMTTP